ncbi:MAG TPA: IPT/TIG domain-containing protein, partial [Candidatus Acidoferrum sp.]|nr:IPT/TIG domain-containing protein [Candidatus Acidoferrum sp.]
MKTIRPSEAVRPSVISTLLLALVLAGGGCGAASNSNPGGGNPPAATIASVSPMSGMVGSPVTIAGANFGATQGASTVTFSGTIATPTSWSATSIVAPVPAGATTGNVVVVITVGGVASNGVNFTVSSGSSSAMGPLVQSGANSHYFAMPNGQAVYLTGSDTWNDVQNTDQSSTPAAFPFTNYVNMLKTNGHNTTILWRKDMPRECNWNGGGTWNLAPQPWLRS